MSALTAGAFSFFAVALSASRRSSSRRNGRLAMAAGRPDWAFGSR